jgi:hypothetical protein
MDDAIWNCVLSICCQPLTSGGPDTRRARAMAKLLQHHGMTEGEATEYAPVVLKALQPLFEVLQPFIGFIAKLARGADFKE